MPVKTALTTIVEGRVLLRGYDILSLMSKTSLAECACLLLTGEMPDRRTARMMEAILVSCVDHGLNAPSAHIARATVSCGVPLASAVAAGLSAIGPHHGGAGEECARILQQALASHPSAEPETLATGVVEEALAAGRNLPGYGHRVHKGGDPRASFLLELAGELGIHGRCCRLAEAIVPELEQRKGARLPLNVDGAHAAILSDMGFPWNRVQAAFLIGRCIGLCAQAMEERDKGSPLSFLKDAPVAEVYEGPDERPLPDGGGTA